MNAGVGFLISFAQGRLGAFTGILVVGVRNDAAGQLAGQFADGVTAHAVGHQKDMTPLPPLIRVRGQEHGRRILIVAAANPDVGQSGMFDLIVPGHSAASQFHSFLYATRAIPVCKGAGDACPLPLKLQSS